MEMRPALVHLGLALAIGGLLAAFTPARWIAASLWVSSAMMVNGAIATVEDSRPGGFDNAEGTSPTPGSGALAFKVMALAVVIAGLGFAVQFLWHP